jgi:hypothetical protein
LKVPHAPVVPQVAVQFTPSLPEEAVAASVAEAPVFNVFGGAGESAMEIAAFVTTVAVALATLLGSVVDLAVMVIVPPTATVEVF